MSAKDGPPAERPKNEVEGLFYDLATRNGWGLVKRGWPDFIVNRDGQVALVEVKPSKSRSLRREKREVLDLLCLAGVRCLLWSPDGGFEDVVPAGGKGGSGLDSSTPSSRDVTARGESEGGTGALFEAPATEPSRNGNEKTREDVDRVWKHYVRVMSPRSHVPGDDDRRIIRAALKVATADELCMAIDGCAASSFHMGRNDRERKYNRLSQIIRGRRGRETTRERIDYFIDMLEGAASGSSFPSGDPGVISQKKLLVQRGWRFRQHDPEAVTEAEQAEEWLREHGIEVQRRHVDGYPTFRALRRRDG